MNSESAGPINGIVTVSGKLSNKLKTLRAMPSGINVTGVYNSVVNTTKPSKDVLPNLSDIMDDESEHSIVSGEVVYESSNNNIAKVSADGTESAGTEEGVATITATAIIDGVVKT